MEDGITRALDPGEPLSTSSYEGEPDDRYAPLPLTLGDALQAFAGSPLVRGTLGDDLVDLYVQCKGDEWARYCGAITDWERTMYLEWVP